MPYFSKKSLNRLSSDWNRDNELYQISLDRINEKGMNKPVVVAKLQAKLGE